MSFWQYIKNSYPLIVRLLADHIRLTAIAVGIAVVIGISVGIFISYNKFLKKPIIGAANVIQSIPSMALLGFAIPFLGIGGVPAVTVVVLYSLLPILKNTVTGITNINPDTLEAAQGIGLTKSQVLTKVQIPLALPVIMAGVRISSVTTVGLMTIAALIGADGLGYLVFAGIRTMNTNQIIAGAIPASLLALFVDFIGNQVEQIVTPISLQKGVLQQREKIIFRQKMRYVYVGISVVVIAAIFIGAAVL